MKKVMLFALLLAFTGTYAQTADDIVNKFIEASGGKEKLNAINTLQYSQLIKVQSPVGEIQLPLHVYKQKDKLFRLEGSLQLGAQSFDFFTVISDTAGYLMLPANPMLGTAGGLTKLDEAERASQTYQMDVAGLFGSLVDYAAKGHKLELLKDENVKKQACYKIKLTLNTGQEITYLISKNDNLIARVDAKGSMAAGMSGLGAIMGDMKDRINKMNVETLYSDYKPVNGIMFPTKLTIKSRMPDSESELTNIQVNKPIDPRLYKAY
jgi:outer membrane lipoprotein-sorting protein